MPSRRMQTQTACVPYDWTQEQRISQAVDRRLRANRKTQGQHGAAGQARMADRRAQTVAEISEHAPHDGRAELWVQ